MRYVNYMDFNVHHIKLFLELAENLNYTKTAEKCCITQSSLSRIIINMENMLGIRLFIRDTSKVVLTPAGRSLYKDFKGLYGDIESSVRKAYRIQQGKNSTISIGLSDGMDISAEMLPFFRKFSEENPKFELTFSRDFDHTLTNKLLDRSCDIVFDFNINEIRDSFVNQVPLFTGPLMLYMLKTNPLCKKESLSLKDIRSQGLLVRAPSIEPLGLEMLHNLFTSQGIEPLFSVFVSNAQDMSLNITEDNQGIIADRFFVDRFNPVLCARPIEGTKSTVLVSWLKELEGESDVNFFAESLLNYFSSSKG